MAGITSDLAKKNPGTPLGGSPGGLRTISAETTLPVHTVVLKMHGQLETRMKSQIN